jgi:hypothetical protein
MLYFVVVGVEKIVHGMGARRGSEGVGWIRMPVNINF